MQISNKRIVFEDEHIQVMFIKGTSKNLIITFGDLLRFADGDYVSAEKPLIKYHYNALGFVAKSGNWYPYLSVLNAVMKLKTLLNDYETIIGYGGSMGGYAVIKFSNILNLSKAIAFVPQYSINPADVSDNRYNKYFDKNINSGMKIVEKDVNEHCFYHLVYDPYFEADTNHTQRIEPLLKNIKTTKLKFSGHNATTILAGSEMFQSFVSEQLAPEALDKLIIDRKKNSDFYQRYLFTKNAHKHPLLFLNLYQSKFIADSVKSNENIKRIVIDSLIINDCDPLILHSVEKHIDSKHYLVSHFDKVLSYNLSTNRLSSYTLEQLDKYPDFILPVFTDGKHLYIILNDYLFIITHNWGSETLVKYTSSNIQSNIKVRKHFENNSFTLQAEGLYLSAQPDASCHFKAQKALAWEIFTVKSKNTSL